MILAVGSNPIVPRSKVWTKTTWLSLTTITWKKEKVGDSVVVLGGGLAGCEAAIHLAQEGKRCIW